MNPCQLNALIAAVANHLYCTLSKKDFIFLNVFFSELSKSMFSMEILRSVCFFEEEEEEEGHHGKHGHHHKHNSEESGEFEDDEDENEDKNSKKQP
ncbi:MAG: hypothetical protein FWG44_05555 [Oscillospiraceae bacterium]|nr:hypothetical protein [Oscillospiraceae bacterium]